MLLVTGATGKLGQLVVRELLQKLPASQLAVGVRNPKKAAGLAALGLLVRLADYDKPETLAAAFAGVERLLLISSSEVGRRGPQHQAVIAAAKKAGVRLLAYTSMLHVDRSHMLLAHEHLATEMAIRASGLPFVLLRHGWYTENYTENLAPAVQQGALLGCAGEGRVSAATRADLAAADAAVLAGAGQEGRVYELAGDDAFTMGQLAAEVARQSGKPVAYQNLSADAYKGALLNAGVPAPMAEVLADSDLGVERGELYDGGGELRRVIGRPTTPLADAVAAGLKT